MIPASEVVQINPGVLAGGGAAVSLSGLILTSAAAVAIGSVMSFSSASTVADFFGSTSTEATLATTYFSGYDNSTAKPGNLLFSQYPTTTVAGYLRGGRVSSLTLAQLQALSGVLTLSADGVSKTSSSINLSAATSFSNAATIIQAAFTSPNFAVAYDSQRGAFTFTSSTTGAASSMTFATGSLSAGLLLTASTGAVLSAGAIAATPAGAMDTVTGITLNWASFMTAFEPVVADKLLFAAWSSGKNQRYVYAAWDTDAGNATGNAYSAGFGAQVKAAGYSGIVPVYGTAQYAAFVMGMLASIDFTQTNGRITTAYKSQAGLTPNVTDSTSAANLRANGYNYYGAYATANATSAFFYPGAVSGKFLWLDAYANEIWLNSAFQSTVLQFLAGIPSVPYNSDGKSLIESALLGPISDAVRFGAIRTGVVLSAAQIAQVNAAAGTQIDTVLSSRGWYLQIGDASAAVRAARGSFPMTFWYMDGGSVQALNMASIAVI